MTTPAPDPRRRLLDRFRDRQRSGVMNAFLDEVCVRGARTPEAIVAGVIRRALADVEAAESRRDQAAVDQVSLVYHAVQGHREAALDLACAALAWEALSPADRPERKAARAEASRRAWMATQAPTTRQVSYLTALGYRGPVPGNRAAASALVDSFTRRA